jgi:elongation factor Ts
MSIEKNQAILEVRKRTEAPISSCKQALEASNWNVDLACLTIAKTTYKDKRSHDHYGTVCLYSHNFGRIGVMVELSCESGYVAKNREFQKLANTIAVHVSWSDPKYISRDQVSQEEISEAEVDFEPVWQEKFNRPFVNITSGQQSLATYVSSPEDFYVKKQKDFEKWFYPNICLLDQTEERDSGGAKTIGELIDLFSEKVGEKIEVKKIARFEVGKV